mgnify:CR=1 FL=1
MRNIFSAVCLILLLAGFPVRAGSRSVYWRPYRYEPAVIGLFHCDGAAENQGSMDDVLAEDGEDGLGAALGGPAGPENGADAGSLSNANPVGHTAGLRGGARMVPEGRFDGGVRLASGEAAVSFGEGSARGTTEFWIRIDALPDKPVAVMRRGKDGGLLLRLHPGGTLELIIEKKSYGRSERGLRAGTWHHISVGADWEWKFKGRARVTLDGQAVIDRHPHWDYKVANFLTRLKNLRVGGLKAGVDEIRISKGIRSYYPCKLGWEDAAGRIDPPVGQPYFRDERDLRLWLGFDQSVEPDLARPDVRVTEDSLRVKGLGESRESRGYSGGVHADALVLGPDRARPAYAAEDLLDPRGGTIAFWLRPLNWDNFTRVDHRREKERVRRLRLFRIHGKKPQDLRPYRPMRGSDPSLMSFIVHVTPNTSRPAPPPIHPGKWTHVALTWKGQRKRLFVDGQRVGYAGVSAATHAWYRRGGEQHKTDIFPGSEPKRLQIEGRSGDRRTLIDDVRLYRRPLTQSEVGNLVGIYDRRRELSGLPPLETDFSYNGVEGRVAASVTPLIPGYERVRTISLALRRENKEPAVGRTTAEAEHLGRTDLRLRTEPFGFGRYRLRIAALDSAGDAVAEVERSFSREKPPWWENELGISSRVMPGWDPVEAEGNAVRVSRRLITFGPDGLPRQVVSAGAPILADAPRISATVGGTEQEWQFDGEEPAIKTEGETRATVRGRAGSDELTLTTEAVVEFDGMMWFRLKIGPRRDEPVEVDQFTIELPYREEAAELIHWWSGARGFRDPKTVHIGAVPPDEGTVFRSNDGRRVRHPEQLVGNVIPYLMLTGDRRGMAWFAENDRGWTRTERMPAVGVRREAGRVVLQLNIISETIDLDGSRAIEFGLHPIPFRQRLPHWRRTDDWGVIPDTFADSNLKGEKGSTPFYLYPNVSWEEVMKRYEGSIMQGRYRDELRNFRAHHDRPPRPMEIRVPGLYQDLQWIGGFPEHSREWAGQWTANYSVHTPEFIDFCAWAWQEWITRTGGTVRGIYMDDCWGAPKSNPVSPATYQLPDGHTQVGYEWRGYRRRLKRLRQVSYDAGITPQFCAHSTHTLFAPYHAFFDVVLDGEDHYQEPPNQKDFIDYWPLPRMRFMNGAKWGLLISWLGWHGNSSDAEEYPAYQYRHQRAYAGMLALHDIAWPFAASLRGTFRLRHETTDFVPYWDEGGVVAGVSVGSAAGEASGKPAEKVRVSAWRREDRCLVLALNVGDERAEAAIELRPERMGFGNIKPAELTVSDVDATLLRYFDEDVTRVEKPVADEITTEEEDDVPGLDLEEKPEDLPVEERRARDPDGEYEWENGILRCPIRRHDYRLFLFRAGG